MLLMLLIMLPMYNTASAENSLGSLTLICVKDDDIVDGMHWQIFKVGYRTGDDYVFTGDFEKLRPTLGDKTKPMLEWDANTVARAAETLRVYAIVGKFQNIGYGDTDANGRITFDNLADGLYLVCGNVLTKGDTTYVPSPIFFEINNTEENVLNAYPKIIQRTLADVSARYIVKKVWLNDETQVKNRAVSITAAVYQDGEWLKDIVLNEGNNWESEWNVDDDKYHDFIVMEKVIPENYTVSYEDNTWQYLIINTYEAPPPPPSETTTTSTTTDSVTTTTDVISTTTTTDVSTDSSSGSTTGTSDRSTQTTTVATTTTPITITTDKIPQTGQTWWPVMPLSLGGAALIGGSIKLRKREEDEGDGDKGE